MTFTIDTGITEFDPKRLLPDWFMDLYETEPSAEVAVRGYAYHLIGSLNAHDGPKKLETVRRHFIAQWALIGLLAKIHPTVFDELLCAYAERAQRFD